MQEFPDGYPDDLLELIGRSGGTFTALRVYRVAKYGVMDPKSYLSTFQEKQCCQLRYPSQKKQDKSLSSYSTSCHIEKEKMQQYCLVSMRSCPQAIVIEGKTAPECGPSRLNPISGHVDWWLFKDARPWLYFHETEVDQNG